MALITICVTAIGTLIIERVARKIYSEIKERYEARIEDRKKWVCIWKISGQYSLCVWNETQIF